MDDIPVTTDGRELCLLVCLVQRAGEWFSSSLALGTDDCCRHNWQANLWHALLSWTCKMNSAFPSFNPHGGPITHNSTGTKPDSPVQPWCRNILYTWLHILSRATLREMIHSRCSEPPSHTLFRYQLFVHSLETSYCTFIFCSRCFLKFQLERYFCHIPWIVH